MSRTPAAPPAAPTPDDLDAPAGGPSVAGASVPLAARAQPAGTADAVDAADAVPPPGDPVDALVLLTALESMRARDLPEDDLEVELVGELRSKRLGLSDTVYQQIQRQREAVKRGQRVPFGEAAALLQLVGRRPDAIACLRESGRRLAEAALASGGPSRLLPAPVARPLALRRVRAFAARYLHGTVDREGSALVLTVAAPAARGAVPGGDGCVHVEAAFRAFVAVVSGEDAAVQHVTCTTRGDDACRWRTEWRR